MKFKLDIYGKNEQREKESREELERVKLDIYEKNALQEQENREELGRFQHEMSMKVENSEQQWLDVKKRVDTIETHSETGREMQENVRRLCSENSLKIQYLQEKTEERHQMLEMLHTDMTKKYETLQTKNVLLKRETEESFERLQRAMLSNMGGLEEQLMTQEAKVHSMEEKVIQSNLLQIRPTDFHNDSASASGSHAAAHMGKRCENGREDTM